jgi:hypothetical protein
MKSFRTDRKIICKETIPMSNSFSLKTIQITLSLNKGTFAEGGSSKIIEGLACEASITKPGLPEKNSAQVKIWGLKYEDMAQLTMLSFRPLESQHNLIRLAAGEKGGALSLIFQGEISSAFADFNSAPDPCMQFEAISGDYPQQMAAGVATVQGDVPAEQLFAQFARQAGYSYQNQGVQAQVADVWLTGSPLAKMQKLARDLNCQLIIDDGTVLTLPAGQSRQGSVTLLSKDTGLIGYPTFNQDGIRCKCLFNPDLQYGGLIKVESIVPRASGVWKISKLTHTLSAYVPGSGSWESQVEAIQQN